MIVYSDKEMLSSADLIKIIDDKIKENIRLDKLQQYYKGQHDILKRYYADPTKPNNKITVNYCKEISDFFTNYVVGTPIEYKNIPPVIADSLTFNDNDETTLNTVKDMNTCGFGCELFYTDEAGNIRFTTLDPMECIIIMSDDLNNDIKAFLRIVKQPEEVGGYILTHYDEKTYSLYRVEETTNNLTPLSEPTAHYFNDVPITLYQNNRELQGSFEQIIPLQDSLNKLMSDTINDYESFVDSYLVLSGVTADDKDIAKMKENRVIITPTDSNVSWLTKNVNNQHIKQLETDLRYYINQTSFLPDFQDLGNKLFASSGEALKVRLIMTDSKAKEQERSITKALRRKMELLYNVFSLSDGLKVDDFINIEYIFKRAFLDDVKVFMTTDADDEYTP